VRRRRLSWRARTPFDPVAATRASVPVAAHPRTGPRRFRVGLPSGRCPPTGRRPACTEFPHRDGWPL